MPDLEAGHPCSRLGTPGSSCLTSQARHPQNHPKCILPPSISSQPQALISSDLTPASSLHPTLIPTLLPPGDSAALDLLIPNRWAPSPLPPPPSPSCFQFSHLEFLSLSFILELPEELHQCINAWVLLQIKRISISKDEVQASVFFCGFLGLHLWHMEVPRLGVQLELQLPAYAHGNARSLTH